MYRVIELYLGGGSGCGELSIRRVFRADETQIIIFNAIVVGRVLLCLQAEFAHCHFAHRNIFVENVLCHLPDYAIRRSSKKIAGSETENKRHSKHKHKHKIASEHNAFRTTLLTSRNSTFASHQTVTEKVVPDSIEAACIINSHITK